MMRIIELTQIVCLTVASQGILGQIVGANREEIYQLCQLFCHENRGGSFNHDAQFRVGIIGDAFSFQLLHNALAGTLAFLDFPDRSDHGEHNGDFAINGCPIQSPQLGAEHLGTIQTDTDGANTQGRILFLLHVEVIHLLVSTNVQSANDYPLAVHGCGNCAVSFKLLIFGGIVGSA